MPGVSRTLKPYSEFPLFYVRRVPISSGQADLLNPSATILLSPVESPVDPCLYEFFRDTHGVWDSQKVI